MVHSSVDVGGALEVEAGTAGKGRERVTDRKRTDGAERSRQNARLTHGYKETESSNGGFVCFKACVNPSEAGVCMIVKIVCLFRV